MILHETPIVVNKLSRIAANTIPKKTTTSIMHSCLQFECNKMHLSIDLVDC
jgi:hypothetical protein